MTKLNTSGNIVSGTESHRMGFVPTGTRRVTGTCQAQSFDATDMYRAISYETFGSHEKTFVRQ